MTREENHASSPRSIQARLDQLLWYHTIDVLPDVTTRGWFDLRHALSLIPWPDVRGKRCLDIGTWDGFYAYELERRGAREIVALDVPDLSEIDYPPEVRSQQEDLSQSTKQSRQAGFRLLHEILGSSVEWRAGNIYDLDSADLGIFDVVVCGSLLVHLRDPVRALDAVRRVTSGVFVSIDFFDPIVDLVSRMSGNRPIFELHGQGRDFQWWRASESGLRKLLHIGGFAIEGSSKPFLLRSGADYRPTTKVSLSERSRRFFNWLVTRDATPGSHPHRAYLTRPRF